MENNEIIRPNDIGSYNPFFAEEYKCLIRVIEVFSLDGFLLVVPLEDSIVAPNYENIKIHISEYSYADPRDIVKWKLNSQK
jgi:hypothetical protein